MEVELRLERGVFVSIQRRHGAGIGLHPLIVAEVPRMVRMRQFRARRPRGSCPVDRQPRLFGRKPEASRMKNPRIRYRYAPRARSMRVQWHSSADERGVTVSVRNVHRLYRALQ